ncbi:hypothetical protein RFI_05349 [Reticulomyxa filosa]|uniref:DNA polymerase alpha/delta/epsilon subunit B domain-containing protein n=1 Tax=Reticulomyxa filosa TaxID=46433 RepID=X6P2I0_RETFI|nr:hypothetical protein RFI_05349 [Reticulomyxa filosa]|eukprot:ETO31767.1 hypothetical protein RFI_05349 [Reticulomyxa filosa]
MLVEMLVDYLTGYSSRERDEEEEEEENSDEEERNGIDVGDISALIIAGDALAENFPAIGSGGNGCDAFEEEYSLEAEKRREHDAQQLTWSLKELDVLLSMLCSNLDVFLMPGKRDPSTLLLPQQPLHRCLFPFSQTFDTFHPVSNPLQIDINGTKFLGTSGQNIHDMQCYGTCDSIECLELTLNARNLAPTACDTLQCFPYRDKDPFVIADCPHVYFAGNCKEFKAKTIHGSANQKITLLAIPSFQKSGQLILVNTSSLDYEVVQFANDTMNFDSSNTSL